MNKLLVIVDTNDPALPALQQAILLTEGLNPTTAATQTTAEAVNHRHSITVLHPVYDLPSQIEKVMHGTLMKNLTQSVITRAEQWLSQAIAPYQSNQYQLDETVVWSSHAFEAIDITCQHNTFELIIKKIDPRSRWIDFLFHGDDWHILTRAHTETLMIDEPVSFNQGVLMVALESCDPRHDRLNRHMLTRVKQLQQDWDMAVVVIHTYPNFTSLPSYDIDGSYYLASEELLDELAKTHTQSTHELLASYALENVQVVVEPGPPALVIQEKAAEIKPTCLMVGNLHNKGLPGFAYHKAYDKLATDVACALWVVPESTIPSKPTQ